MNQEEQILSNLLQVQTKSFQAFLKYGLCGLKLKNKLLKAKRKNKKEIFLIKILKDQD